MAGIFIESSTDIEESGSIILVIAVFALEFCDVRNLPNVRFDCLSIKWHVTGMAW